MTLLPQNNWLQTIAIAVIIGMTLFAFKSQWTALRALEVRMSDFQLMTAYKYVPRQEFTATLNRLEDTIQEAIKDAKSSGR